MAQILLIKVTLDHPRSNELLNHAPTKIVLLCELSPAAHFLLPRRSTSCWKLVCINLIRKEALPLSPITNALLESYYARQVARMNKESAWPIVAINTPISILEFRI